MATDALDTFLRAEEEASRLVNELTRLKEETESYRTAREALGQAAKGVSELATQLAEIAGQLGGTVGTLGSIGTPELLRGQEAITSEVAMLRQHLGGTRQSIIEALAQAMEQVRVLRDTVELAERARQEELQRLQQGVGALATAGSITDLRETFEQRGGGAPEGHSDYKEDLRAQLAGARAAVRAVRNLAFGSVALVVIALALLGWLVLSPARG